MQPQTEPAEPGRARLLVRVSVMLGGSFAGQAWKIKFDIGQSKARESDLPDEHPAQLDAGTCRVLPGACFRVRGIPGGNALGQASSPAGNAR